MTDPSSTGEMSEEAALVALPSQPEAENVVRRGHQTGEMRVKGGPIFLKATSFKVSATTASFILLLLFFATLLYSDAIDLSSFTSIQRTFQTINIRPQNYTHIPQHPLNCSNTPTNLSLTCPANFQNSTLQSPPSPSSEQTCPDYFRWIHEDLKPWKQDGITEDMIQEVVSNKKFRHFRLVVVNGTAYVKQYDKAYQTRDDFTLWGVLQLLKMYPGQLPDLDLVFQCHDQPSIKKLHYLFEKPPPLFHYCGSDKTYDIVFPDWSFWGWPEINVKPWTLLKKDLEQGNKMMNWTDRQPYAYWKGNLYTGGRRKLGKCNSTKEYNALIYQQDWGKEIREGFKNSDMSKQCTHRYKLYMEGNAWSVSEKYILACDSMSLLVNPFFYDFFTRSLVPTKHYWPINPDNMCKSVKYAVDWGNAHPEKAQVIGKEGSKFVQEEITMKKVYDYMFHLLSEYGKLLAYRPTVPPGSVELCSEKWVCTQNELERTYKAETLVEGGVTSQPCSLPPPFNARELKTLRQEKDRGINQVKDWERRGKI